jgi:5-methyltetrahydropteroyltriglutamate--homocysteine methyltransferase
VSDEYLEAAQDDATLLAIGEMERAGVELITDGEIRRESYSNRFATALDGVDIENPGEVLGRSGQPTIVPRVVGPIKRNQPVQVRDVEFLRANTTRRIKVTVPGPFTMSQQVQNDYYPDRASLAMDYAVAVNQEMKALFEAGADVVQLDEPWLQAHADEAKEFGVAAINKALEGITGTTGLHLCFGYAAVVKNKASEYAFLAELEESAVDLVSIEAAQPNLDLAVLAKLPSKRMVVGVIDLEDAAVESPEAVAARVKEALKYLPPEKLMLAPDCGMKYLPRDVAFGKLQALVQGVELVRRELR